MTRFGRRVLGLSLALFVSGGCFGSTGTKRLSFAASAGGVPRTGTGPMTFTNERGFEISLSRADVTVGPIYLNVIAPRSSGETAVRRRFGNLLGGLEGTAHAAGEDHLGSGRVVGQVLSQVTFDALSEARVPFPTEGVVTNEPVRTVDLWFFPPPGEDPQTVRISRAALSVEGRATRGGKTTAFRGALVLDDAWLPDAPAGSRQARTIAEIREVRGIATAFVPDEGGSLEIRLDVAALFRGADFDALEANPVDKDGAKKLVQSKTTGTDQVLTNLFQGLKSNVGTWQVRWLAP